MRPCTEIETSTSVNVEPLEDGIGISMPVLVPSAKRTAIILTTEEAIEIQRALTRGIGDHSYLLRKAKERAA